jgi:hypothetical protein
MKTGIELISDERRRQVDQLAYTSEADAANWPCCELASAAAVLAATEHIYYADGRQVWPWEGRQGKD